MKLFKNKVGRPSKDTLKKKRILATVLIFVVVLAIGACVFYTVSYFRNNSVKGANKNIVASGANIYMVATKDCFITGNKLYTKDAYISLGSNITTSTFKDNLGSNIVYSASNGKGKIIFKGNFGADITKHIGKNYSKLIVQVYNSSNQSISQKSANIKSSSASVTVAIPKNAYTVKVSVVQAVTNGVKQIFAKTINISTLPTVSATFVDKAKKNSSGLYVVNNNGNNRIKYNLGISNGRTLYYSVFTYNGHSLTSANVSATKATCVAFNKTITTPNYTVNVNSNVAIGLRIYSDLSTCKSDTNAKLAAPGNNRTVLKELDVKYLSKYTTLNKEKYTVLTAYDKKAIGKNIGTQDPKKCFTFALRYGAYILGKSSYTKNSTYASTYGATDHQNTDKHKITDDEIYAAIVKNINNGKPVVIRVTADASPDHYVLVVGYRYDKEGNVDSRDDIWVIDPYSKVGYSKKGENVMWEGPAEREETIQAFHTPRRYLTW